MLRVDPGSGEALASLSEMLKGEFDEMYLSELVDLARGLGEIACCSCITREWIISSIIYVFGSTHDASPGTWEKEYCTLKFSLISIQLRG